LDDPNELRALIDALDWVNDPWPLSHQGAGVFAAKIICETPTIEWQNAYFEHLAAHCDKKYGLGREGCIDISNKKLAHHLNGWFHYLFNFNHCHREIPHANTLVDTLIDQYYADNMENHLLGHMPGFREIDWVFALNRASLQTGHRREEAKEAMRHFTHIFMDFLKSIDPKTNDSMNDLHMLFGACCALAELQAALPGKIITEKPLRLVLDRRPFI
jgi:hypothetical protein